MKHFPKENGEGADSSDSIEIPVGSALNALRRNPWIASTVLLVVALVVVIFLKSGTTGNVGIGKTISEQAATQQVLTLAKAQFGDQVSVGNVVKNGSVYAIPLTVQGRTIPVYVTLDGQYLAQPMPDTTAQAQPPDIAGTPPEIADINISNSPMKGNKAAAVVLVEFTDYQCPFCGRHFTETYPQIIKNYVDTGKVLFALKNFPLSIHPEAPKAAEAALCVRAQQGDTGYWKMHDKLFGNQQDLSVENEKKWAREIGVNGAEFDSCLDSGKFKLVVDAEEQEGLKNGVNGTPSFFINGKLISGACPYDTFVKALDAELAGKSWSAANCQVQVQ